MSNQYVYILLSNDNHMLKVGVSSWYEARHKVLSESTPFKFSCVMVFKFQTRRQAEALEAAIKKALASYRAFDKRYFDGATEWFTCTDFVKCFVRSIYTKLRLTNLHKVNTKSSLFKS